MMPALNYLEPALANRLEVIGNKDAFKSVNKGEKNVGRIVGGKNAHTGQIPWQARYNQFKNEYFCLETIFS